MFLMTESVETQYVRLSKLGQEHAYKRRKILAVFRCDSCDEMFKRDLKHMDRKRLSNNYFHCCSKCDTKRFAQKKGVDKKKIWDMPASSTLPVGRY